MIQQPLLDDVIKQALSLDLAFSGVSGQKQLVPFALTPGFIELSVFSSLQSSASLLGRLTQQLANNSSLIQGLHAPLVSGDPFFAELLSIHHELHASGEALPRVPLLLQRSDFMLDPQFGPRLVECNSIAAGMAPFGEQIQHLHQYVRREWPKEFDFYSANSTQKPIVNNAIKNFSTAIANAAERIRVEHADGGTPAFLMVVQEGEDNVFDQQLLERALQRRGVRIFRRTFRELHEQLSSGPNQRLLLKGCGAIDVVYLRAGYQYRDYLAIDLDTRRCCDALRATRVFIERHRVAVNATVAQQLATSKCTQQFLSEATIEQIQGFDLTSEEALSIKNTLAEMRSVDASTAGQLKDSGELENWVLKNQGEGGGHCLFDEEIVKQLDTLSVRDYSAWALMRRLRPVARTQPTIVIRNGEGYEVHKLVSEIGLFTAHYEQDVLLAKEKDQAAYLGYLVRSKPPDVTEGGIHSGSGMLDSLASNSVDQVII